MKFFFATLLLATTLLPIFVRAENPIDKLSAFDKGLRTGMCNGVENNGGTLSLGCQLCDLVRLVNKLIQFMTAFAFGIAVIFFLYASYLIMWGGANAELLSQGKNIAKGTVVGLIIVLSSWVVINTIFQTLVHQGSSDPTSNGKYIAPWKEIKCTTVASSATPPSTVGKLPPGTTISPTPESRKKNLEQLNAELVNLEDQKRIVTAQINTLSSLDQSTQLSQLADLKAQRLRELSNPSDADATHYHELEDQIHALQEKLKSISSANQKELAGLREWSNSLDAQIDETRILIAKYK